MRASSFTTLAEQMLKFQRDHEDADLSFIDMRRSGSLELGTPSNTPRHQLHIPPSGFPAPIERLEGYIVGREIPPASSPSKFAYFLDGAQKTLPVGRVGLMPISVALSAAGILERDEDGYAHLLPGSLREQRVWIIPLQSEDPDLQRWIDWLEAEGETVRDPLEQCASEDDYHQLLSHYGRLIELSQRTSGELRSVVETELLDYWEHEVAPYNPDRWLVVDGAYQRETTRAIGLVKAFETQHLAGTEAIELFSLAQGHRTTAFRPLARRPDQVDPEADTTDYDRIRPTTWYERFWDASGLDARHGLARIETSPTVATSDAIDEIAAWLMTERLPRATMDARWPTLLYPIHFLEEILKRRLAAMTAGWPS